MSSYKADSSNQPHITSLNGRRHFACSPVAVLGYIVNEADQILLLKHPERNGGWQVINGALEAGETILAGVLREVREEAGPKVRVRPLGTVHVQTFHYDEAVRYMISVAYVMAYEGGRIEPGDDMAGSQYRWWSLDELADESVKLIVPPEQKWLVHRAVELYRLWKTDTVKLQPELRESSRT